MNSSEGVLSPILVRPARAARHDRVIRLIQRNKRNASRLNPGHSNRPSRRAAPWYPTGPAINGEEPQAQGVVEVENDGVGNHPRRVQGGLSRRVSVSPVRPGRVVDSAAACQDLQSGGGVWVPQRPRSIPFTCAEGAAGAGAKSAQHRAASKPARLRGRVGRRVQSPSASSATQRGGTKGSTQDRAGQARQDSGQGVQRQIGETAPTARRKSSVGAVVRFCVSCVTSEGTRTRTVHWYRDGPRNAREFSMS